MSFRFTRDQTCEIFLFYTCILPLPHTVVQGIGISFFISHLLFFALVYSPFSCDVIIFQLNITFPSEVLVVSDKRPYSNLTFHNVLARQGSSNCNRARWNFQAFALRDMNIATREGCRVGQKMSYLYHFSFCQLNSACTRGNIPFNVSEL